MSCVVWVRTPDMPKERSVRLLVLGTAAGVAPVISDVLKAALEVFPFGPSVSLSELAASGDAGNGSAAATILDNRALVEHLPSNEIVVFRIAPQSILNECVSTRDAYGSPNGPSHASKMATDSCNAPSPFASPAAVAVAAPPPRGFAAGARTAVAPVDDASTRPVQGVPVFLSLEEQRRQLSTEASQPYRWEHHARHVASPTAPARGRPSKRPPSTRFAQRRAYAPDDVEEEMESNRDQARPNAASPPHHSSSPPTGVAVQSRLPPTAFPAPPAARGIAAHGPRSRIPPQRNGGGKCSRQGITIALSKSKNKCFKLVHPLHLAVIFFSAVAIAMMAAAVGTNDWYAITWYSATYRFGLFKVCVSGGSCESIKFNTFSTSLCTRSGSDRKRVNDAVIGLAIAGVVLSLIASVLAGVSRCVAQAVTSWLTLVAALLCTICYAAAVGTYVNKKENWEFCSVNYCAAEARLGVATACGTAYGYSLALAAVAVAAGFVSFLFAVFRVVFQDWSVATGDLAPRHRPRAHDAPVTPADLNHREPAGGHETIPPPPEGGDWVYDGECSMYWSASEYLFLHPQTQHSYDPESGMWYDPDAGEWYQGEPIES